MKNISVLLLCLIIVFFGERVHAEILSVPDSFNNIQAAIDAAQAGDSIVVAAGTYYENIIWSNVENLYLISSGDSDNTIINGSNNTAPVISLNHINSAFIKNFTLREGKGGLHLLDSKVVAENLKIVENELETIHNKGAGIYAEGGSVQFLNCYIAYNRCLNDWEDVFSDNTSQGAGVWISNTQASRFENCIITNNTAKGIQVAGVGLYAVYNENLQYIGGSIEKNYAEGWYVQGAGVYAQSGDMQLSHCQLTANSALAFDIQGAGLFLENGQQQIQHCFISRNTCIALDNGSGYGAAIFVQNDALNIAQSALVRNIMSGNGTDYNGAGMYINGAAAQVAADFVTIASNSWDYAGQVCVPGIGITAENGANLYLNNSITWNESTCGSELLLNNATAHISYSCLRNNWEGNGNIGDEPLFVAKDDFRLRNESPCINAAFAGEGTVIFNDLEGNDRPLPANSLPDMGAYENDLVSALPFTTANSLEPRIYPNPFFDKIYIQMPVSIPPNSQIFIYDSTGKIIKQAAAISGSIDTSTWQAGVYLLIIHHETAYFYQKIIK